LYNDYGYLEETRNAASGYLYRRVTAMDEAGHITGARLANDLMTESRAYNGEGTMASVEVDSPLGRIHAHYYDVYDDFMNLISERNGTTGLTKSYRYDTLNRLESYSFSNTNPTFSATVNYGYDKVGNFLKKSDYSANSASAYRYGGSASCAAGNNAGPNAVCQLTKLNGTTVSFQYDKRGNLRVGDGLTMTYNAMDKPLSVDGRGASTNFVYGSDNMRAKQTRTVGGATTTTYYVDKYYEADSDGSWRAYLDDIAVLSYTPQRSHLLQFTLRDRLGSATTLADQNGNIVSQRYFDPFGKTTSQSPTASLLENIRRMTYDQNVAKMLDLDVTNKNRRGFTDHEHLNEQQLIHMNGRIYDYNLGRFMSVDPFIQAPTSTQSVNPYSYIMNNPLAGTDPTGYAACSSTGSHIKGQSGVFCSAIEYGSGGSGKKQTRSEATKVSNGAPLVQEELPANLQTSELNGQGQTARNWDNITSTEQLLALGQGLIDDFNDAGGGNWLFGASTAGGAAELAFSGTSLTSGKGAFLALSALGTTTNEWAIIRGASSSAGSYSFNGIGVAGKIIGNIGGGLGFIMSLSLNTAAAEKGIISIDEFRGKVVADGVVWYAGTKNFYAFLGAAAYGGVDLYYGPQHGLPGIVALKRDVVSNIQSGMSDVHGYYQSSAKSTSDAYHAFNNGNTADSFRQAVGIPEIKW
jgi:RHS repeat-associated protein